MPYIKFPEFPLSTDGRSLTGGVTDPVTGEYFASADEVVDTDNVVTDAEYAEVIADAEAAYVIAAAEAAYKAEQAAKAAYEAEQAAEAAEADQE